MSLFEIVYIILILINFIISVGWLMSYVQNLPKIYSRNEYMWDLILSIKFSLILSLVPLIGALAIYFITDNAKHGWNLKPNKLNKNYE